MRRHVKEGPEGGAWTPAVQAVCFWAGHVSRRRDSPGCFFEKRVMDNNLRN